MATGDYIFGKDCTGPLDDSAELAYVGSAVAAETDCDAYTNKVGGRPVLFAAQPTPRCAGCGATLALVLQAYLPLAAPPDDRRQLLVCVCTSPRCRLPPAQRFAAFRVRLEHHAPATSAAPPVASPAAPAPSLFAECDSWGDDDDDEDEKKKEDKGKEDDVTVQPAPASEAAPEKQPEEPTEPEETPAVLGEAAAHPFAPRYLETEYEPDAPAGPTAAEAALVRELLARYEARKTAEEAEDDEAAAGTRKHGSSSSAEDADVYEHAAGDRAFRRFQRRVQRAPAQVLRWCYGGRPLQLCDATPLARVCVPRCARCGARRVFEAQLMPALLDALAPAQGPAALPFEFGSVLVCTCGADCNTRGTLAPEHVVWQPCL